MRSIWSVLIVIGLLGASPAMGQGASSAANTPQAQQVLTMDKDDRILGNPEAPITIVEYASMTCPHCAHFEKEVLPKLKKKWIDTGKAKLVLRPFPLDQVALRAEM